VFASCGSWLELAERKYEMLETTLRYAWLRERGYPLQTFALDPPPPPAPTDDGTVGGDDGEKKPPSR